jgi:hypothetical protein
MMPNQPMGETPPMEAGQPPQAHAMPSSEVCVPLSALASPGEDDQLQTPAVGDRAQFQSEGKISRIEGDNAFVTVESVNGKPVTKEDEATHDTPDQDTNAQFEQLQSEASMRSL